MKRAVALILSVLVLFTGCSQAITPSKDSVASTTEKTPEYSRVQKVIDWSVETPAFSGLNDEALLRYLEDEIYSQVVSSISTTEYIVERVSAVYLSKEYLEETAYNSKENIFFGYSLSDLDQYFGDTKYVFTTGEDGQTVVKKLTSVPEEEYYNKIIKNVAIGAGVILVCVVITVATEGAGAPAAAAIFAASAKTAATCALSGMVISGVSSGLVKAYQTGDLNESLKAAAVSGSEGFKWGAIGGAVSGGAREAFVLSKATANGLSLNDVARIQNESGYPLELIREFHTMDEYTVFRNADLFPYPINGQTALIRADIDPYLKDEFGVTNLSKMLEGKAPISNTGETFELHHIGQNNDGILAILTSSEHDSQALHGFKAFSEIDRNAFAKIRSDFWKSYAELIMRANG